MRSWWSGEGGKDLLQERSWEMGFPMPRAKEQINARNVSFENNSQRQINIINSVKIFYDPTLNCSTAVSLETYLLYLSNMILI